MAYDATKPAGTDLISDIDTLCQANFVALKALIDALPASGQTLQTVCTTSQMAESVTASAFPMDNTAPLFSEGAAYSALDTSFTPTASGNTLLVEVVLNFGQPAGSHACQMALFKDASGSDACVASAVNYQAYDAGGSGYETIPCTKNMTLLYSMTTTATDAITFKVRVGASQGTIYPNKPQGAYTLGNTVSSWMKITEVKA